MLRSHLRRIATFLSLLALLSCGPQPPAPIQIRFEQRIFEKALAGCVEDGKPDCATVRLEYPEFTAASSEAVRQKLNAAVQEALLAPFEEGAPKAEFPEQLSRYFFEAFDAGYGASWFLRRTLTVEAATPLAVSITEFEAQYTGRGEPRETRSRLDLKPN